MLVAGAFVVAALVSPAATPIAALSSTDFVVTFQRGVEWAATEAVTQKVPAGFPTADTVSYRADLAAMDPDHKNGLDNLDLPGPRR